MRKKRIKNRIFLLKIMLERETHGPSREDIIKTIEKLEKEIRDDHG